MRPLDVTPLTQPPRPRLPGLPRFPRSARRTGAPVRPGARIGDDRDLAGLWSFLTAEEVPASRTLWLAMLDADGRAVPTVFPIGDCPDEPGLESIENLAGLIGHLVEDGIAATVPALLARPGPGRMGEPDRRWARTLRTVIGPLTACWPTFLLTSAGLRPFAPDDLVPDGRPAPGKQRW